MTLDTSPVYDCPTCKAVQTVIDAGDAQGVHWCRNCRAFFTEFELKSQASATDADRDGVRK